MFETLGNGLVLWVFPALMIYAGMTDLLDRRIANWVSLALIGTFFILALVTWMPFTQLGAHLGVALAAFAIGFLMFAMGWMGGGDVKLITAAMLWFGPTAALGYALTFSLTGLVVTAVFAALRLDRLQYALASNAMTRPLAGRDPSGRDIPYGLAISGGALLALPALAGVHGAL